MKKVAYILFLAFACASQQGHPQTENNIPAQRNWSFTPVNKISNQRQEKQPRISNISEKRQPTSPLLTTTHEFIRTPNFDVLWLTEKPSNPDWKKYASLFSPSLRQYRQMPPVQLRYLQTNDDNRPRRRSFARVPAYFPSSYNAPSYSNYDSISAAQQPSMTMMTLNRYDVESLLGSLGKKKHILVLRPRNCNANRYANKDRTIYSKDFETRFLPKFVQQLQNGLENHPPAKVDHAVEQILKLLNNDEKKIIAELYETFVSNITKSNKTTNNNSSNDDFLMTSCDLGMACLNDHPPALKTNRPSLQNEEYYDTRKFSPIDPSEIPSSIFKDCDSPYVFQVENRDDPFNDIVLKVMKIIAK